MFLYEINLQLAELEEVWKGLSQSIALCKQEIDLCESLKKAGNYPSDLLEALNDRFTDIDTLLPRFRTFEHQMKEVQEKVDELLVDYCVDVSGGNKGAVFELFTDLGKQCKLAYFDNNPAISTTSSVVRVSSPSCSFSVLFNILNIIVFFVQQRQKRVQVDANKASQNLSNLSASAQISTMMKEKAKNIRIRMLLLLVRMVKEYSKTNSCLNADTTLSESEDSDYGDDANEWD